MPKPLVIVESPAKARTIAGFLGSDYRVEASVGHIRDLPMNKDQVPKAKRETHGRLAGVNPDDHFDVAWIVPAGKRDVVKKLKAAMQDADEVILATDEDREGESISWHVLEVLDPKVPVKRMVFHEITPQAIRAALETPGELNMKMVEAAEGRRILDRLMGWELSSVLRRRVSNAKSAGRVQSVATRLVVERERARMAFRRGSWFGLAGTFSAKSVDFAATLVELDGVRIAEGRDFDAATGLVKADASVAVLDEAAAAALAGRLEGASFAVTGVESSTFEEKPKAPFTTSTLQQEAGRKLRYPAAKTMAVAQRLYERGFITYMRTDSTNLSEQAVTAARAQVRDLYGDEYLPDQPRRYTGKVKNAQEAHEAIRPAGETIRTPEQVAADLDADERAVYDLIWMRTVASQMTNARARRLTLRLGASSQRNETVVFRASGKTYEFLGFRRAYVEGVDDESAGADEGDARLPAVVEGDPVAANEIVPESHETKPPARFTEASLVKEMEERGIGRPSTYAATIATILARGYVWKKGTALVPTWTGFAVVKLLEDHFGHLVDYGFTATMEEALDAISNGQGEAEKWLHAFYFGTSDAGLRELVTDERIAEMDMRAINTIPIGTTEDGRDVIVRVGRYGPFVQAGPDEDKATGSLPPDLLPDELTVPVALEIIDRMSAGPQALGEDPATGLPVFVLTGRFGPYVQLGEFEEGSKVKPPRASLFKTMTVEHVTLDDALQLLSLPRVVGADAEGVEITAQNGKFGPYLKKGSDSRSLEHEEQLFTITLAEAEAIFAQPKRRGRGVAKPPLAEFGDSPDTGKPLRVLDGRFGPYVTDGETNATVPRGSDPTELSLEEALALVRARAALGPRKKKAAKKKAAKKKAAPKKQAAKKATKKQAALKQAKKSEDEAGPVG